MFRATKIAVAAVMALAMAVLPVVLDQCAGSCEAHRHTIASTPACHHTTTSTGTHIAHVPIPCGHGHNGTAITAANNPAPTGRAFHSSVAVDSRPTLTSPAVASLRVRPHSPASSALTLDRRSPPLRV
jgi:hypothetical protein